MWTVLLVATVGLVFFTLGSLTYTIGYWVGRCDEADLKRIQGQVNHARPWTAQEILDREA